MVELSKNKEGIDTFTILCDGFIPKGFVQMECRLSDMTHEPKEFFITVFDEDVIKNGDYSPLELKKEELKQFIEFLHGCYEKMP